MLDRAGITRRFLSCFPDRSPAELAAELGEMFQVTPATVFQWLSGVRNVPWSKIKTIRDTRRISWDWLIEGNGPKNRNGSRKAAGKGLNRHAVNQRFLSLFPGVSNTALGEILGVRPTAMPRWRSDTRQVPWEKLKFAVDEKGVTWEYLLEGQK